MPTVDLSERDSKETLFVKEEVTNDAEVFEEVVVDVEGSQRGEPSSSVLLVGVQIVFQYQWISTRAMALTLMFL